MKTLYYSIIVILLIVVLINTNSAFAVKLGRTVDDNGYVFRNDQLNQNYSASTVLNSPLKQIGSGISTQNIVCSSNLELIYKSTNDYPACVTPQTGENLIKRGWGILQPVNYLINISGFLVHYNITGGNIQEAKLDTQYQSLTFSVNMANSGMLNVTLPRALVDAKCTDRCILPHGTDIPFAILNDHGQQAYFTEIGTTPIDRTLSIQVPRGLEQIEISHIQPV